MLSPQDLGRKVGRKVLFIGVEAYKWSVADFGKAAANARAMGFDTISPKRADGGIKWYGTAGHLALERQACLAAGCGFLPFTYSYGPRFGNGQIDLEVAVAKEIASVCDGLVCMDMEVEWNGQVGAAQYMASKLHGFPGDIILSTWADPVQQNWVGVLQALAPVMSAIGPQQYTNWLVGQEGQLSGVTAKIFPELDVADLFGGANDPLGVLHTMVSRNHASYWIWEYQAAMANPNLMRTMTALIGSNAPATPGKPVVTPPAPVKLPAPVHTLRAVKHNYVFVSGDSLSSVAAKLGLANWFQDLYVPNRIGLDNAARSRGNADSNGGALIFPGDTISYTKME